MRETQVRYTTSEWIKRARKVHGEIYDYDNAEYVGSKTEITVTCSVHGDFRIRPTNHLCGRGCPKCSGRVPSNVEQFVKRAVKKHGDAYDYRKVRYVNAITLVKIICAAHGMFKKTPSNHLAGQGCIECRKEKQRLQK